MGPLMALLATAMMSGTRMAAVMGSISHMYARPWEAVAVKVLAPAEPDEVHRVSAECSDSTHTNSVVTSAFATYSANFSTMMVWGVIGYAAHTSVSICFHASATALSPLTAMSCPNFTPPSVLWRPWGRPWRRCRSPCSGSS